MSKRKNDYHVMALVKSWATGWDEYFCPVCRRRFIMRYPPRYKKIILEEGNPEVDHRYSADLIAPQVAAEPQEPIDPARLAPWEEWLSKNGYE